MLSAGGGGGDVPQAAVRKKRKVCRPWSADDLVAPRRKPSAEESMAVVNGKMVSLVEQGPESGAPPLAIADCLKLNNNAIVSVAGLVTSLSPV